MTVIQGTDVTIIKTKGFLIAKLMNQVIKVSYRLEFVVLETVIVPQILLVSNS